MGKVSQTETNTNCVGFRWIGPGVRMFRFRNPIFGFSGRFARVSGRGLNWVRGEGLGWSPCTVTVSVASLVGSLTSVHRPFLDLTVEDRERDSRILCRHTMSLCVVSRFITVSSFSAFPSFTFSFTLLFFFVCSR